MAGICGWLDDSANSSPADLSSMAAALARFDGAHIQTAQKPCYGLAAADIGSNQSLAEEGDLLVAYSGAPSFANRDLNELSRARGRTAALAEGFADRQDPFQEPAAVFALRAERQLSRDHGWSLRPLRGVVGRLDPLDLGEGPQPVAVVVEFAAHSL